MTGWTGTALFEAALARDEFVWARSRRAILRADRFEIRVRRETSGVVAGIHELAVRNDVELARFPRLNVHRTAPARFKPSLHTEGFGLVASTGAVMDQDGHVIVSWNEPHGERLSPRTKVRQRQSHSLFGMGSPAKSRAPSRPFGSMPSRSSTAMSCRTCCAECHVERSRS